MEAPRASTAASAAASPREFSMTVSTCGGRRIRFEAHRKLERGRHVNWLGAPAIGGNVLKGRPVDLGSDHRQGYQEGDFKVKKVFLPSW